MYSSQLSFVGLGDNNMVYSLRLSQRANRGFAGIFKGYLKGIKPASIAPTVTKPFFKSDSNGNISVKKKKKPTNPSKVEKKSKKTKQQGKSLKSKKSVKNNMVSSVKKGSSSKKKKKKKTTKFRDIFY